MKKEYRPYTYFIHWSSTGMSYYGAEYSNTKKIANPKNLWEKYFTSSTHVKKYRIANGEPDIVQVRRIFSTREETVKWETRVLNKLNAAKSPVWMNRSNGGKNYCGVPIGYSYDPEVKAKMKGRGKGVKKSKEHMEKLAKIFSKTYLVTCPDGEEIIVTNLNKFCKERGLNQGNMSNVVTGRYSQILGYKCKELKREP